MWGERLHWYWGVLLADGRGVEKDAVYGMTLVGQAAGMGSAGAAYVLGDGFYFGALGLPKNPARAKEWFGKVASAKVRDLDADSVERAATRVRGLSP